MKLHRLLCPIAVAVLFSATAHTTELARMLPVTDQDLTATTAETVLDTQSDRPRQPIHYSWALSGNDPIEISSQPFVAASRSYSTIVDEEKLREGFEVHISTPGPVLRLDTLTPTSESNPIEPQRFGIEARELVAIDASGNVLSGSTAFESVKEPLIVDGASSLAARVGANAFRLHSQYGHGRFTLKAPASDAANHYRLHVFERDSDLVLKLKTRRSTYLLGDTLWVEAEIEAQRAVEVHSIESVVVSPAGERYPLTLKSDDSTRFTGQLKLTSGTATTGELWRVGVRLEATRDGLEIRRDAQTSFAYALPTARLTGAVHSLDGGSTGPHLNVSFDVDAGTTGRYELRGVLFGSDRNGQLLPMGVAHTAAWLESGDARLELVFDNEVLDGSMLKAPFEIRDLRLIDQGQRGLLHHQARAVVIE